jgi:carbon storage regulator
MLVLTRKVGQQLKIGDNIVVEVVRQKGGALALGVTAPRDVRVVRGELPALPIEQQPPKHKAA